MVYLTTPFVAQIIKSYMVKLLIVINWKGRGKDYGLIYVQILNFSNATEENSWINDKNRYKSRHLNP